MENICAIPCPLAARVFLARARSYATCDVEASAQLQNLAEESAYEVGLLLAPNERISLFLVNEPGLLAAFRAGRTMRQLEDDRMDREARQAAEELKFLPVWVGEWQTSFDGVYETLPRVCQDGDRYIPELEVSWMGGEPNISASTALPSLEAAIAAAHAMDSRWHASLYGEEST